MKSIILALMALVGSSARASDLTTITRAKSPLALELAIAGEVELKDRRDRCKLELSSLELPRSCFEVLRLEDSTGLIARSKVEEQRAWLERVCVKRARGAARLDSLENTSSLPISCREAAAQRLGDLRYRLEDEKPDELFRSRLDDVR